jgi:hypothetical protein
MLHVQANTPFRVKTLEQAKPGKTLDMAEAPSEAFDLREVVVLTGETAQHCKQMLLPIIRTDAGGFFGFGEHDGPKLDDFEGRFAQLLPPKRPGAEARCRQEPGVGARGQDDVPKARGNDSIWALIYEPAVVLSAKRC